MHSDFSSDIPAVTRLAKAIQAMDLGNIRLMEVCGTHTMAIAKSGIKQLLPSSLRLISGPGCPVCVTPSGAIDQVLDLSQRDNVIITTYGDMLRVPGSVQGDSLQSRMAKGASVHIVYSPIDAVELAEKNPYKQVVFLGVGFETTAPGTAAAIETAIDKGLKNFSVLPMLKLVEPALRRLLSYEDFLVDGFICPGHVATIIGEDGFEFLPKEYGKPSVICGFETEDIMVSIYKLMLQIKNKLPYLENEYIRAVCKEGNPIARMVVDKYFIPCDSIWRGIGLIEKSGLTIRDEYSQFNAIDRFMLDTCYDNKEGACSCGSVIIGKAEPTDCPLFGTVCIPENPVGPCMVSSEGACAACYKYQQI